MPPSESPVTEVQKPGDQAAIDSLGFQLRGMDGQPLAGNAIQYRHVVGGNPCPDRLGNFVVDLGGPVEGRCTLVPKELPKWLNSRKPDQVKPPVGQGVVFGLDFNCNIDDRSTHQVQIDAGFALDCEGNEVIANGWKSGDRIDIPVILDLKGK